MKQYNELKQIREQDKTERKTQMNIETAAGIQHQTIGKTLSLEIHVDPKNKLLYIDVTKGDKRDCIGMQLETAVAFQENLDRNIERLKRLLNAADELDYRFGGVKDDVREQLR